MDRRSPIYITSTGYDPEAGLYIKDPDLHGTIPTLGACRPDLREKLYPGDYLFVVSGKIPGANQFIVGGFEVAERITAVEAYQRFPHLRLHLLADGQLAGNVVIDENGKQHRLDHHDSTKFDRRVAAPFIVGKNPIIISDTKEVEHARNGTMPILETLFGKHGRIPRDVMGRMSKMDDEQVRTLLRWLNSIKAKEVKVLRKAASVGGQNRPTIQLSR